MSNPVEPFAVLPGEGTPLPIPFGGSVTIKAQTSNTNGSLTVLEFMHPPKAGPALHLHFREDEAWYVLEGDYRFKVGDAMFRVSEGGMAFGPRGAPHGFQNVGDTPGRLLVIATPRGWSGSSSSAPNCCLADWIWRRSPPLPKPTGPRLSARRSGFPTRSSDQARRERKHERASCVCAYVRIGVQKKFWAPEAATGGRGLPGRVNLLSLAEKTSLRWRRPPPGCRTSRLGT